MWLKYVEIKINEPRRDYFFDLFDPNVTLWGHFFCTCPNMPHFSAPSFFQSMSSLTYRAQRITALYRYHDYWMNTENQVQSAYCSVKVACVRMQFTHFTLRGPSIIIIHHFSLNFYRKRGGWVENVSTRGRSPFETNFLFWESFLNAPLIVGWPGTEFWKFNNSER